MFSKRIALAIATSMLAAHGYGQSFGLPIATSAKEGTQGNMAASGGLMAGERFVVAGGRYALNVMDEAFAPGFSAYAEAMYTGDPWIGLGIRYDR